jgi:hypothetical protein
VTRAALHLRELNHKRTVCGAPIGQDTRWVDPRYLTPADGPVCWACLAFQTKKGT